MQGSDVQQGVTLTLGAPVRGGNMFGRERELAELSERLRSSHVLLLAPRRVGKTSLMYWLLDHPQPDQEVIFLNVEDLSRPEQFVVELADELQRKTRFAGISDAIPGLKALRELGRRIKSVSIPVVGQVELAPTHEESWREIGGRIFRLLAERMGGAGGPRQVLIIIDEFPYFIRRMAQQPEQGVAMVEDFLTWFRGLRQAPQLTDHVRYLLGGSIGLSGVLGRLKLTALVNDVYSFPLGPYGHDTALRFLRALELGEKFPLADDERLAFLRSIGHLLPFYIQLLFAEMKHLASNAPTNKDRVEAAFQSLLGPRAKELQPMVERLPDAFPDPLEMKMARLVLQQASQQPEGIARAEIDRLVALHFPTLADDGEEQLLLALDTLEHDGYLVHVVGPDDSPGQYRFQSELLRRWWKRRHPVKSQG